MTKFLLALCGLPVSGKTTLAEQIRRSLEMPSKVQIVSADQWRDREYYSRFEPKTVSPFEAEAIVSLHPEFEEPARQSPLAVFCR